ncbi:hypothetical protein F8388_006508 [Cannabis sativa]|uniref:Uncharacterized protein n=1 Tax=Cannabis sativa TaxID=3483 RepID=A0A7J6FBP9_CANSA|nr:hypothetical protein F8388_006508 [Cannabis sativa]
MGGRGRKRREKNYLAAHGGNYSRLPPPPNPSQLDALPSKLRTLISLTSPQPEVSPLSINYYVNQFATVFPGSTRDSKNAHKKRKNGDEASESNTGNKDDVSLKATGFKDVNSSSDHDDTVMSSANEKKKKKRKRKAVEDLRFVAEMEKSSNSSKRREHKKKYLEARKNKHKKTKTEENLNFPGHEKIEFGDIVKAPLKLLTVPKVKKTRDVSDELVRLQAIESYRKSKGWSSRLGIHLPLPAAAPTEGL